MDVSDEKESGSADPTSRESSDAAVSDSGTKSCADCRTTKTPLWRGGPSGPKSLCNACGIRFRKRRREGLGVKESLVMRKKRSFSGSSDSSKKKWKQQRRMLGEEEERAAVLLMALSTGFFYA